jgi:SAM-dependent methyltransferase
MLKPFEYFYLLCNPLLPPLYRHVRRELFHSVEASGDCPAVLDVGGRKSHYTIGLPAAVTVSDLPRTSEVQNQLNLGTNDQINELTRSRRSNVKATVYDDMTRTNLPANSYDVVVAVEVLEHVEEDVCFVQNVARILRPGGWFVMTTPNGDATPVPHNTDHKRHYRREQLRGLLAAHFEPVEVHYAIKASRFRSWGLKSWSLRRPIQTVRSMLGNVFNSLESSGVAVRDDMLGTRHLLATARKAVGSPNRERDSTTASLVVQGQ